MRRHVDTKINHLIFMSRKVCLSSLLPQRPRLLPSLWCGQLPASHTGSIFHCSLFLYSSSSLTSFISLSPTPPRLPMVETINRAAFHVAVWRGYHLYSLLPFLLTPSLSPSSLPVFSLSLMLIPPTSTVVHSEPPNIAGVTALHF